jgi:hypothetical protein
VLEKNVMPNYVPSRDQNGGLCYTTRELPEEIVLLLHALPDAVLRISKSGVPHVLLEVKGKTEDTEPIIYSVCWFKRLGFFRIFYPWLHDRQTREDCATVQDVVAFFANVMLVAKV